MVLDKKTEVLILLLIFLISFSVRWFRLSEYLFFGFEQGRDALIVENIYKLRDFVLTGPSTSIGGVFHGPWYYYLLTLPYGISSGNPLAGAFLMVLLGSFVPVVYYFWAKDLLKSTFWSLFAAFIAVLSYEYILYSRWLSNVSPAPLFIAISMFSLFRYTRHKGDYYFLIFVISAALASLFQMILIFQFIFVFVLMILFRIVKFPRLITLLLSLLILVVLFSPLILFDFRNQHISLNSLINFFNASRGTEGFNLSNRLSAYLLQSRVHFALSLINIKALPLQLVIFGLVVLGLGISYKKDWKDTSYVIFWCLISLPVILISPGNPQYYVGAGLGFMIAFLISLKAFWERSRLRYISLSLIVLFLIGFGVSAYNLNYNNEVFFRTIQDDLNLADQKSILDFVHKDASLEAYRLIAFTIPSLHPEGWEYLQKFYYPKDAKDGSKLVYVVIEKHVYPVWEEKWIGDLGKNSLIFERKFGQLRVQKRIVD